MTFVYILQSELDAAKHYAGLSNDPVRRLEEHNGGKSIHTNKYRLWKTVVSGGFADAAKATVFERSLKSGSARQDAGAFACALMMPDGAGSMDTV